VNLALLLAARLSRGLRGDVVRLTRIDVIGAAVSVLVRARSSI